MKKLPRELSDEEMEFAKQAFILNMLKKGEKEWDKMFKRNKLRVGDSIKICIPFEVV